MQYLRTPIALAVALSLSGLTGAHAQDNANTLPDVNIIDLRGEQMDSMKYTRQLQEPHASSQYCLKTYLKNKTSPR